MQKYYFIVWGTPPAISDSNIVGSIYESTYKSYRPRASENMPSGTQCHKADVIERKYEIQGNHLRRK